MMRSSEGVCRRQFLVLGSTGLAALCFGGAAQAQPLIAGALVLGEVLTLFSVLGAAMILGAIWLARGYLFS